MDHEVYRIEAAGFSRDESLRKFDFEANPNIEPATIHALATCEWIKTSLPVRLIGDSGTGKSQLLIALGIEAAMAGFRVKCVLDTKLVNEFVEVHRPLRSRRSALQPFFRNPVSSMSRTPSPPRCSRT